MKRLQYLSLLLIIISFSCDNNDVSEDNNPVIAGTGAFNFEYNRTNETLNMNVFYHIPAGDVATMPVLFVFHGNGRNASEYRNAWIDKANEKQIIIVTPEFSSVNFPDGDAYNLGNVFEDGDNPSPSTLNPEQDWAFSVIEPLFNQFKNHSGSNASSYDIFGFSAGAQFAHRFMFYKPNARFDKIVASAAGWYTVPNPTVDFPYGIRNCPIENTTPSSYFSENLTLQIGTLDNSPNAPSLRRNTIVDEQGDNRYDRAFYMFNFSQSRAQDLGVDFNWQIIETPGNDHDDEGAIEQAAEVLAP